MAQARAFCSGLRQAGLDGSRAQLRTIDGSTTPEDPG